MRIVLVSAHFPPNFVSGGTISPQRLARGLLALGHDVRVYAGWLGGDRAPLDTWEEVDETGLPLRWIAITPWTGWHDERNYDNADATADFAEYLAATRPDVVHFHSLQTLGVGLVAAAVDLGVPVVVTMHDFWWVCARQFLVSRDFHPCCLVVTAGTCPCEVDRGWLERRNVRLAATLARVDLVLTPSHAAAAVLRANGVDPRQLRVDENGLPPQAPPRAEPRKADGTLRLLYTGGFNRMKGVHVLLDATSLLQGKPGWQLAAHDVGPYLAETGRSIDGLPIETLPPFPPEQASDVMSRADVLVLPSVMRESHSIVTREALQLGVPVVCTDTLGPEEVVEDGRNGLIVPAGDAAALAHALARLLDEPELLPRLRAGAAEPVAVRTLDDQVVGLERVLAEVVGTGRQIRPSSPVKRVLFITGIDGAPLRYRAHLPAEALGLLGVESEVRHYRDHGLDARVLEADAVIFYRVPATHQVLDTIHRARDAQIVVVYDVDDLIFDPDIAAEIPALSILPRAEAELWMEGVRRYRTTLESCDAFVGSTGALCRHVARVTGLPAERFDNGVGVLQGRMADLALRRPRAAGPLRVGYFSGTDTHDHDWRFVEAAVLEAVAAHPDAELWLGGFVPDSPELKRLGHRVRRLPMMPWTDLTGVIRDVDVNLAPLEPGSRFNEAKSAIKWLEAALVETPSVASPTEPFREAIRNAENGILATDPSDWHDAVARLLTDGAARRRLGARARRDALLRWSPHLQGRRYLALLERVMGYPPAARDSRWEPLALDEPPMAVTLEPYELPDLGSADGRPLIRRMASVRAVAGRIRAAAARR